MDKLSVDGERVIPPSEANRRARRSVLTTTQLTARLLLTYELPGGRLGRKRVSYAERELHFRQRTHRAHGTRS